MPYDPQQPVFRMSQLYEAVPQALPRTDELAHEQDILYVAGVAAQDYGITDVPAFIAWLHRQEAGAKISKMWDDGVRGQMRTQGPPAIVQIAKYLRSVAALRERALR